MTKHNKNNELNTQQNPSDISSSPELISRFLDLQQQEIELRREDQEIHIKKQEHDNNLAEASISAQLKDRESERVHLEHKTKLIFIGSFFILLIILIFFGYAIFVGKEDIVIKIAEIIGIFIAGFIGGYGFKSAKLYSHNE
jgi:hypothetical protein